MSTLAEARREWIRRVASDPNYQEGITLRAHQGEYILPVFRTTKIDDVIAVTPPDVRRMVLALLLETKVRFSFHYWDFDEDERPDLPGIPEEMNVMRGEVGRELENDATVGDLVDYVEHHGRGGIGTLDEMLKLVIRDRERSNKVKRTRRDR